MLEQSHKDILLLSVEATMVMATIRDCPQAVRVTGPARTAAGDAESTGPRDSRPHLRLEAGRRLGRLGSAGVVGSLQGEWQVVRGNENEHYA